MSEASILATWLGRLETISTTEIVLGLDRMQTLLGRLDAGRPRRVLHVGGTNGKGSSVAMLSAIFRGGGYLVGAYTSPHLVRYNERIAINGEPAADADIVSAFERIDAARGDIPLTYFEFGTLAALLVFADHDVDVAVFEVGLGGRLDAVNAIEPDAVLITSVALDHQDWLGETREQIAAEKAGIMRPGKPAIYAEADRPRAIDTCAAEVGAQLIARDRDYRVDDTGDTWGFTGTHRSLHGIARPALPGDFQLDNAGGVLALLEAAKFDDLLNANLVGREFAALSLPGRLQVYTDTHRWRLDVAHNPAAALALAPQLGSEPSARRVALVGMLDDKDVEGIVAALDSQIDDWIAVPARSPRALPAPELARRIANRANRHCLVADTLEAGILAARDRAGADGEILVFGSFNVVGPVLESLGL